LPVARLLLESEADPNKPERGGKTPLHQAARHGYRELCEALIAAKADVGAIDTYKYTPLHQASANGHGETFWLLLLSGASLSAKDQWGRTPVAISGEFDMDFKDQVKAMAASVKSIRAIDKALLQKPRVKKTKGASRAA
jgi:tankyrase